MKISHLIVVAALAGLLLPGFAFAASKPLPKADPALYAATPPPLQPVECGQCHSAQFASLKQNGGKHRFACQECHEVIHAYNPRKDNYAEIMPVCTTCHGQQHGPTKTDCLGCHQNPHAPKRIPALAKLGGACQDCHTAQAKELASFPSAHSEQGCQSCHHDKHGYIPNCFECHEGHYEGQAHEACMTCHDRVHAPLQITLPANAALQTCSGCHGEVYAKWSNTPSKHGKVTCTRCHEQHGQIPDCRSCHGEPHNKRQLEMFPDCLTCHLDVHDLPVRSSK
jgi:hypothetical protein